MSVDLGVVVVVASSRNPIPARMLSSRSDGMADTLRKPARQVQIIMQRRKTLLEGAGAWALIVVLDLLPPEPFPCGTLSFFPVR